jgi:hypothetical protein
MNDVPLDIKRAAVTALVITIQQYWSSRKSPVSRGYIKQSIKALRYFYYANNK